MSPGAGRVALWLLVAAKLVTGWGVQWDIEWHVVVGRDSFWIAPHVMTYAGVAVTVLVSWAALGLDTLARMRGGRAPGRRRVLGLDGSPGFHLAAWGIALTVLAAPVDDLWHRLFGLDVTLWSPPHLLGIAGAAVNTCGCLAIAREVHAPGPARTAALVAVGALLFGTLYLLVQPANLTAYRWGGALFYTLPMLSALVLPLALVPVARLSGRAWAPLAALALVIAIGLAGQRVAEVGFARLRPVSVIDEEIRKDPASPIALSQAIARQNGRPAGRTGGWAHVPGLLPAAVLGLLDPRRRPVAASLGHGATLFGGVAWALSGLPAFASLVPGPFETALALAVTLAAAAAGGLLARLLSTALVAEAPALVRDAPAPPPAAPPLASRALR